MRPELKKMCMKMLVYPTDSNPLLDVILPIRISTEITKCPPQRPLHLVFHEHCKIYFQIGSGTNKSSISVAKIIPPSRLWTTILRCRALRSASWTVSLRSKTISLLKNEPKDVLREIIDASSRSHGSGWRREKSSMMKH